MSAGDFREWDGAHFGREQQSGVVLGLDLGQVIFLGVGVGIGVIFIIIGGFPFGLLLALLVAVIFALIGIPRVEGISLLKWGRIKARLAVRRLAGQTEFIQPTEGKPGYVDAEGIHLERGYSTVGERRRGDEVKRNKKGRIIPPTGRRFKLPGEFDELQVFALPGGAAFVYDPRHHEAVLVAQVRTERAYDLESDDRKEDRARGWADTISAMTRIEGIVRVQCSDQTTIISGNKMVEWYRAKGQEAATVTDEDTGEEVRLSGAGIDPFLDAGFTNLMAQAKGQSVHENWIAVVLSRKALARKIRANGGRLRGFMDAALSVMGTIEEALRESGAQIVDWHTPRSVAALTRASFDPSSTMEISERSGRRAGVAVESAGPMHATWTDDVFTSDGALHRTFKISEWPQEQAVLGFLHKFVLAGDFRHTVSLYIVPRDGQKAFKDVARRKADWSTNENLRQRLGRPASLRHERLIKDIEDEESQLVSGHAPVRLACLITVSGFNEQELEAHCGTMRTMAQQAGCEIRKMGGEQESAFVASATPFGRLFA